MHERTSRRLLGSFGPLCLALISGCFQEATSDDSCSLGSRGCACARGSCLESLVCRSDYCVEPDCTPGALYCGCNDGLCVLDAMCLDGSVCVPRAGESDGSTATGTSTSNTSSLTGAATDESSTTGSATGTEAGTSSEDTGTDVECSSAADCRADEYCDFPDDLCGSVLSGRCQPREAPGSCVMLAFTGCDCQAYTSDCDAHAAGTDTCGLTGCGC